MPKDTLCARVRAPWQMAGLAPHTPVLLALSGGADSRLLLHLLAERSRQDGFFLLAAHVHHGIRGDEADRDLDFCRRICADCGVELSVLEADVPRLAAEHGRGLEEEARAVRYGYFASLMREREIPMLVTAHNADDNAETVLFRLARGTGMTGLCGIAPVRPFESGYLVRPMLGLTKREILAACLDEGLDYVTDSTNADTAYARNRLRAEVLPVLEELFPGAAVRMGEMCEQVRGENELLSELARTYTDRYLADGGCPIDELRSLSLPLRRRVVTQWLALGADLSLARVHTDALIALIDDGAPHKRLSLPKGVEVCIERGRLCRAEKQTAPIAYTLPFSLGRTDIPDGNRYLAVREYEKNLKVHNLSIAPYIFLTDQSVIMNSALHWRTRKEGDRILMRGMHRSVRRLLRETGLSPRERASLPILCAGDDVLWVPFVGARDGAGADTPTEGSILVQLCTD